MTPTLDDTKRVLARAAVHDQRFTKPNTAVLEAWHDHLAHHSLELHHALRAVDAYYADPRDRVIQIGDVIHRARTLRRDEMARDTTRQITAPPPADASDRAIFTAYRSHDAISRTCAECGAPPNTVCTAGERQLKIPHLARMQRQEA